MLHRLNVAVTGLTLREQARAYTGMHFNCGSEPAREEAISLGAFTADGDMASPARSCCTSALLLALQI